MKNITQTILLGLALCCLMVSNGFGQITEWQMIRAKYTVMRYCELITKYGYAENTEVAQDLERLFVNNNSMIFNVMNEKEPYLNLAAYLNQIDKQRNNDFAITFTETLQTIKLDSADFVTGIHKQRTQYITATITQKITKDNQTFTETLLFAVYPNSGKIYHITQKIQGVKNYEKLSEKELMVNLELTPTNQPNFQVIIDKLIEKGNCYAMFKNILTKNEVGEEQNNKLYDLALKGCDYAQMYVNVYLSEEEFAMIIKSKSTPATFDKIYKEAKQQGISQMEKLANQNWSMTYDILGTTAFHKQDTLKALNYWKKGHLLGDDFCTSKLLLIYKKGLTKEIPANREKYVEVCKQAAARYNPEFQLDFGNCIELSDTEAERMLQLAVINGNDEANYFIASYHSYNPHLALNYIQNLKSEVLKKVNFVVKGTELYQKKVDSLENLSIIPDVIAPNEVKNLFHLAMEKHSYHKATKLSLKYSQYDSIGKFHDLLLSLFSTGKFIEGDVYFEKWLKEIKKSNKTVDKHSMIGMLQMKAILIDRFLDPTMELGLAKPYYEKYLQNVDIATQQVTENDKRDDEYISDNNRLKEIYTYLIAYYKKYQYNKKLIEKYQNLLPNVLNEIAQRQEKAKVSVSQDIYQQARNTLNSYCKALTTYSQTEDAAAGQELKKVFVSDKNIIFNDLNPKEPYTEVRYYLKNIELQRNKGIKIEILTDVATVEFSPFSLASESKNCIKASIVKKVTIKDQKPVTQTTEIILDNTGQNIINTFSFEAISADEAMLPPFTLGAKAALAYQNKDYEKAITLYKKAIAKFIDRNNAALYMYDLAGIYLTNYDDGKLAIEWYKKAAQSANEENKQGNNRAIAMIYMEGEGGITKNYAEAVKYFLLVNDANSYMNIGNMYEKGGYGLTQNYTEAANAYLKGSTLRDENSPEWLAHLKKEGRENEINSNMYFCVYHLADLYYKGLGVEKNLLKAAELYRQAAENGDELAQSMLAKMLWWGEGIEKNEKEGREWLLKSMKQGNSSALFRLCWFCYLEKCRKATGLEFCEEGIKYCREYAKLSEKNAGEIAEYLNLKYFYTEDNYLFYPDSTDMSVTGDKWVGYASEAWIQGYYDDALKGVQIALRKGADKKMAYQLLAEIYLNKNDILTADTYGSDAIKLGKSVVNEKNDTAENIENILTLLNLYVTKMKIAKQIDKSFELGMAKKQVEDLLRILDLPLLTKTQFRAELWKKAIPFYKQLGNEYLAKYYQKNKQTEKAIFHYEKLLEITPEDQEAKQAVETLKK
jgi:TPR repeat protein